jgi:hypothetical protein
MNIWTQKSIELANQQNYLDLLYKVYPMSVNLSREFNDNKINTIKNYLQRKDNIALLETLLKNDIFPIKDSYVAYLKKDKTSLQRNPNTIQRLTGLLYEMGINEIVAHCTVPKETNRQMGQLFRNWINSGSLGVKITTDWDEFLSYKGNIVLNTADSNKKEFSTVYLGYTRNKGLDFVGKFNDIFVIAEAKFLTDFGGHQDAQYADAISTLKFALTPSKYTVKKIAILDGVLYINGSNYKMQKSIRTEFNDDDVIISAVLLRDYLFSL